MSKRVWVFCCIVVMLLAGCGGSAGKRAPNDPTGSGGGDGVVASSEPAQKSGGFFGGGTESAQPTPPPASVPRTGTDSSARSEVRPSPSAEAPRERPGLGTEWGETRTSRVHDVTFVRADAD